MGAAASVHTCTQLVGHGGLPYTGAAIVACRYLSWRKEQLTNSLEVLPKPEPVTWLNQSQYDVFVAICDTLIPAIDPSTITLSALKDAFSDMCPDIAATNILHSTDLSRHEAFFLGFEDPDGALSPNLTPNPYP